MFSLTYENVYKFSNLVLSELFQLLLGNILMQIFFVLKYELCIVNHKSGYTHGPGHIWKGVQKNNIHVSLPVLRKHMISNYTK